LAGVGDPGDEHVVGVVDEVVSGERVDELALAATVCDGDGHKLAVTRALRDLSGPDEKVVCLRREQCSRDEDQWIVARLRRFDDRPDRDVVASYEPSEELVHAGDDRGRR